MGPICIECGGGGGSAWRRLMLSTFDVTDPENIIRECSQVLSWIPIPGTCNSSTVLTNMGMAFSLDKTKLLIANPDLDLVEVLDVETGTLGIPIPVGDEPVDVVVVRTAGMNGEDRAYVADRLGKSIHIIRVADLSPLATVIDLSDEGAYPLRKPVALAARSDGRRLFVAESTNQTVGVFDIDSESPDPNSRITEMVTGGEATRLILLRLP